MSLLRIVYFRVFPEIAFKEDFRSLIQILIKKMFLFRRSKSKKNFVLFRDATTSLLNIHDSTT